MNFIIITLFGLGITFAAYLLAKVLYKRWTSPFLLPILTATSSIMILLTVFDIPYETYYIGAKWLDYLLGPASLL